jgi:hypothetical protein
MHAGSKTYINFPKLCSSIRGGFFNILASSRALGEPAPTKTVAKFFRIGIIFWIQKKLWKAGMMPALQEFWEMSSLQPARQIYIKNP